MGTTPYATPADLWTLALPPDALFGEQGIEPGTWTDPTRTAGTGLGGVQVWDASHPRSDFAVKVQVASGGELNEQGYLNPGAEPTVRISLDGGVTYSRMLRPDASGRIDHVRGGFTLLLANGISGSPITVGAGNSSLVITPKRARASITVLVGGSLAAAFKEGALVLTVGPATTSAAAAAYLQGLPLVAPYLAVAAGGDGSGVVAAAPKIMLPFSSFVPGDVWSFSTTASPDILSALQVASDLADGYLSGTFRLPLTAWASDLRQRVCELARWQLLCRRGLDRGQDVQVYNPASETGPGTRAWFEAVQGGNLRPLVTETPPGVSFPLLVPRIDPLSRDAGAFPI